MTTATVPKEVDPSPRKQLSTKLSALQVEQQDQENDSPNLVSKITPIPISKELSSTVKKVDTVEEPLLTPNPQRFVLFPIKYHDVIITLSFIFVFLKWILFFISFI